MTRIPTIAALVLMFAALPANAAMFNLAGSIDGIQSGTGSTATGLATATYDNVSGLFSWNVQWAP
ncbi:MAG: hypothetical protein KJO55_01445, partial [Gammaproteobacteria bacterium]|nr:hypothetical protein [Gammaproteobacteria bacterium]